MASDEELDALQAKLHYRFRDQSLLLRALTHPSVYEHSTEGRTDNEVLATLGDAVLGLAVADVLWPESPKKGDLTTKRADLVNDESLSWVARDLGLDKLLKVGKGEKSNAGGETSRLATACEALMGAVYLDSKPDRARALDVVRKLFENRLRLSPKP